MMHRFQYKETIVSIICEKEYTDVAEQAIFDARKIIEDKIDRDPFFRITYDPYPVSDNDDELIQRMCKASQSSGVGPMAGVAAAIAVYAAEAVRSAGAAYAIIENGGDIALFSDTPRYIGLFADHPVLKDIAFEVMSDGITGICSSSSRIGPSVSLGNSNICTVFSDDVILADCCATLLGNMIKDESDLADALEHVGSIPGVKGCFAGIGDKVAMFGDIPKIVEADVEGVVRCMYPRS